MPLPDRPTPAAPEANKRTGFAAAATFLDGNALELSAPEGESTETTIALAAGEASEEEYAASLRHNSRPA